MASSSPFALRPSFSPVWGNCSGAVKASANCPNIETDASREGDAAHWLGALILCVLRDSDGVGPDALQFLGVTAPNGVAIDEKIVQGVHVYVDEVMAVAGDDVGRLMIEHTVHIPSVHAENGGSLDCALWLPERSVLFIWDYKNGHRAVDPCENFQFTEYAEGLTLELGIDGLQAQRVDLIIRVVQPFCYNNTGPVVEWACKLSDIRGAINTLHTKAHEALSDAPLMSAGTHCRDCPAVGTCSTARRGAYIFADVANQPYELDGMNSHDLAVEREILTAGAMLLKARLEAVEADLQHRIEAGETGSGLVLEGTYGRIEWTVEPAEAINLAAQFGFDISKVAPLTPTQAKAAAPKEVRAMFEQVMRECTKRPPRGLKLTNAGDTIAARAFSKK